MFNYDSIDKTPTVSQVDAIIQYMKDDKDVAYNFTMMLSMTRTKPLEIMVDLNNAHFGTMYKVEFNNDNQITSFKEAGSWMS